MSDKRRPYTGRAVVDGKIRFSSVSQITLYDKESDGCPRKWVYPYVFGKKLAKTESLNTGIEGAGKLEHFLKTGENVLPPVLQPAQKFFPEPQNPMTGEFDLEVERPLGIDFPAAVFLRDALLKPQYVSRRDIEIEMRRLAGLVAADVPLDGAPDFRHCRGTYKNEDGVETAEHPGIRVVETGDLKMISRIKPHKILSGSNAGTVLPGWAKTSAQVCDTIQMVSYARHAVDAYPDATHHRLSHVYGQKSSKGAAKRTGLISVEEVLRRFSRVEGLMHEMIGVATASKIEDVEYNTLACDSYTHVAPDGSTQKGCGHKYYCPIPTTVVFQNMLGQFKESAMSLFDTLPVGAMPGSKNEPSQFVEASVSTPLVDAVAQATIDRAAVEEHKARLRAEDAQRLGGVAISVVVSPPPPPPPPAVTRGCGAAGCGDGCTPGFCKSPGGGLGAFVICGVCGGRGASVSDEALPSPPLSPMAVTPPDAPGNASLIDAAEPLPAAAVAEITNPALQATVEQHQREHQAREAEKARLEAEAKVAAGTNVWCSESNKRIAVTTQMAIDRTNYLCVSCGKKLTLVIGKEPDGSHAATIKRHKPVKVEVPVATAMTISVGGDDCDDEDVSEVAGNVGVVPPPPSAPASAAASPPPPPVTWNDVAGIVPSAKQMVIPGTIEALSPTPPLPPPSQDPSVPGDSTRMVNGLFGSPSLPTPLPPGATLRIELAPPDEKMLKPKVKALEDVALEVFNALSRGAPLDAGCVGRLATALFAVEPRTNPR